VSAAEIAAPEEGLLERVEAVLPLLRANAARTEEGRRVAEENIDALIAAGVFRMTVARRYGGYESSLQTQYEVIVRLATACPSTGWVATILSGMLWSVGRFADEAQDEVFADPRVRITSVFAIGGTARAAAGGVIVSGRWPFNTGCLHAQWAVLNALTSDGAGALALASLLIPYAQLEILDDWHAGGMSGTGSNTTIAEEVFVPSHRIVPVAAQLARELPSERNRDAAYWRVPTVAFLLANAAATPVGIARGALAAFIERLPRRPITYTDYAEQSHAPVTHLQVGEAMMKIHSADAHSRRAIELAQAGAVSEPTLQERALVRAHGAQATALARDAVDVLYRASGASAIQRSVPIQRYQRDIQALGNHTFLVEATSLELLGRIAWGLEPNTTFV
jgi:3-hydroxy-9,10-secoandrosta-1,3,5(10)-triene-9,17-dione monooxygenase